jgi:HlyD family secretion protein
MDLEPLKINRDPVRRKRSSPWLPRMVAGVVALLLGLALFVFWRPLAARVDAVRLPEVRAHRVERSHPAALGAVQGIAANGYVVAARRAALSADTPGRIVELNVTEGSVVKAGDVVARLFSDEYEAALRRAEAERGVAKAALSRADAQHASARAEEERAGASTHAARSVVESSKAELELARQEIARVEQLLADAVVTQRDLDTARATFRGREAGLRRSEFLLGAATAGEASARATVGVAVADLNVAKAQLTVAEAARDQAKATFEKTLVRAPFDGVVVLKDAEVGEVVSVQGGDRGSVVTMVDFASLEVQADVPETSLGGVVQGGHTLIFLDAFPERPYKGQVERIWPTANRSKATVEVRIRFLKRDQRLRPEMGVRVVFLPDNVEVPVTETARSALLLPEDSVVSVDGNDGVFVLDRDSVTFRALRLGKRRAGRVEVIEGLVEGERVVITPPPSLEDGSRVIVREE